MRKILAAFAALCLATAAVAQPAPAQWSYSLVNNVGTASYPGNVFVAGTLVVSGGITGGLVIGTTPITSGTGVRILYDNNGTLNELTPVNNAVMITNSSGVPLFSTTLPAGTGNASFSTVTGNVANDLITMSNTTVGVQDSGIALSAVPKASNGTWTPVDSSGASLTFTSVTAKFTSIGNMEFVQAVLTFPSTASNANIAIGGLPVAAGATIQDMCQVNVNGATPNGTVGYIVGGTSVINVRQGVSATQYTNTNLSALIFMINCMYPKT